MIGVVLWSDHGDQKAVFWCEDHGDLAYYDGATDAGTAGVTLNAGDMVEFEMRVESKVRKAQNPVVVKPKVCHGLEEHLRASASEKDTRTAPPSGKVVPFSPKAANGMPQRRRRSG